ncbi:MAG: HXXEE domain-containing protein [Gemmatimonadaceae bacterium]
MATSWFSPLPSTPFHRLLLAAPLIFVAHVVEEAPGFVTWVNAHIDRDITQSDFWTVNVTGLLITLAIVLFHWMSRSRSSAFLALTWIGFVMAGNAVLHTAGAIVDKGYAPGVITALLLYVPFSALIITRVVRTRRLSPTAVATAVVIGALPMLAHGYMILFRGTRLF